MLKTLYHGTSVEFDGNNIDLNSSSRPKDFGNGFYLTSIYKQARIWSIRNKEIKRNENEIVKKYEYNEAEGNKSLKIYTLNEYNKDWLRYIITNRNKIKNKDDDFDLVIGLMADSNVKGLIKDYISDYISEDELLEELKFHYKNDQYTFKSDKSLIYLKFIKDYYILDGSDEYDK